MGEVEQLTGGGFPISESSYLRISQGISACNQNEGDCDQDSFHKSGMSLIQLAKFKFALARERLLCDDLGAGRFTALLRAKPPQK
jgi:hypothetical protein